MPLLLLLGLLLSTTNAWSPFSPYRCDDDFFPAEENAGDCYSVNRRLCQYRRNGCLELTATFDYYNTVEESGFPREDYTLIEVLTSTGCGGEDSTGTEDGCTVFVDGQECTSCTMVGDRGISLDSCDNIPGALETPQQLFLTRFGSFYLELAYNADRCQHPAINGCPVDNSAPANSSNNNLRQESTDTMTFVMETTLEFSFFPIVDSQYPDGPEEASEDITIAKSIDFFLNVFEEGYPNSFQSFRMSQIFSNYEAEERQFTLTFTTDIVFDADAQLTVGQAALVLKSEDLLRDYMLDIRYAEELVPNGMFLYTSYVAANVNSCSTV